MKTPAVLVLLGVHAAASAAAPAATPRVIVTPEAALADARVSIRVDGLAPGALVTLRTSAVDSDGRGWSGEAAFRADAEGAVDPGRQKPLSGTYEGVDAMGLLWSMRRVAAADGTAGTPRPAAPQPGVQELFAMPTSSRFAPLVRGSATVTVRVLDEGGRPLAETSIERLGTRKDAVITEVREGGMVGRLYEPPGGRRPAILVVGGSNGGIQQTYAPVLAGHGYVTFALAYFREEGLPKDLVEIPLEYFEHALAWLRGRPSVDPDHVAVMGLSRGGELVLLLGATFPRAVQSIVALSPADLVWEGAVRDPAKRGLAALRTGKTSWTLGRRPLPFVAKTVTPELEARLAAGGRMLPIEMMQDPPWPEAQGAAVPVERIQAPVLMISSRVDPQWNATRMAERALARMRAAGARRVEHLAYDDLAHALPDAWWPVATGGMLGGSVAGSMHAYADYWPRVLAFLEETIGRPVP